MAPLNRTRLTQHDLERTLRRIDGRPYPAYKDTRGSYTFEDHGFVLEIIHVQGDPFAAPSLIEVRVPVQDTAAIEVGLDNPVRRVGVEDALLRLFSRAVRRGGQRRGSGKSGQWGVVRLGQEILARTACEIRQGWIHLRMTVGLPARGRRIQGIQAAQMFGRELPSMIESGVFEATAQELEAHANANEDQDHLRHLLDQRGWVAFIANGAVLPRRSGIDDRPLDQSAVSWRSPPEMEASVVLPHAGKVTGTAIPEGVTLICGGGYHGKSTVLRALSRSVYNHIPEDGRHLCATVEDAVMVRAEDGRRIEGVDISAFINNLPDGRSTTAFDSDNASGSTSQAAAIMEALEVGAACLLIDEDTSATNFMVRDRRMQELIATDKEPITPFVDRVRELDKDHEVSTVLVVGGAGDYFEVADHVLVMDAYRPRVATEEARQIAKAHPSNRLREGRQGLCEPAGRVPLPKGFDSRKGRRDGKVRARETRSIQFGEHEIDVSLLGQLIDDGQTRTIGDWLLRCERELVDGQRTLEEICEALEETVEHKGLSSTTARGAGNRVLVRRYEFAAALNRLRTLKVRRK